jgi:hypothetical protein
MGLQCRATVQVAALRSKVVQSQASTPSGLSVKGRLATASRVVKSPPLPLVLP